MPFSPRFTVSATGSAGIAPAASSSAASTRSITIAIDERPRRVVDEHARRAPRLPRLSRPSRTESCRAAPPGTGRQQVEPGDGRVVEIADRRGDRPRAPGRSADAPPRRSTEWRSSAWPPRVRYCLGRAPPSRVPRPAATTRAMQADMGRKLAQAGFPGGRALNRRGCILRRKCHCNRCAVRYDVLKL